MLRYVFSAFTNGVDVLEIRLNGLFKLFCFTRKSIIRNGFLPLVILSASEDSL